MPLWLSLPLATGLVFGLASLFARRAQAGSSSSSSSVATGRVARVEVEGRRYFVMSLGGGRYEVRREDAPEVWLIISQQGETASGGAPLELNNLRADMARFPATMFDRTAA